MTFTSFKPVLASGASIDFIWLSMGSAALAEVAAHAGPAAIVLDLQHGLWERGSLEAAVGIAGGRVPVIARCAENTPCQISRALDCGASSVLVPMVETAREAELAVMSGRYPPAGTRSAGGVRPLLGGVDAMLQKGGEVAVGIMIETVTGVENAEAIAAVPGLDYIFIGTGDLALSRGPGDPSVLEQDCLRVLRAARAQSIPCGLYTGSAQAARESFAKGYRIAVSASDFDVAATGFKQATHGIHAK